MRITLTLLALAAAVAAACAPSVSRPPGTRALVSGEPFDVVILNGRVMDPESGLDAVRNVGVRGGAIQVITEAEIVGRTTVEARGLVVAPGFIDLQQLSHGPEAQRAKVLDGVTAAFRMGTGVGDIDEWYEILEGRSLVHFGAAIGHPPLRAAVLTGSTPFAYVPVGPGATRAASPEEIAEIRGRVEHGLRRGALGVAVSPRFTSGATPWEILEMFRAAAAFPGSPVHALVRNTAPEHWLETAEVFLASLASGAPLHIMQAHFYYQDAPHLFEMIETARTLGLDITTEVYPYTSGMGPIEFYEGWQSWPDERFADYIWPPTGERLTRESFGRYHAIGGLVVVSGGGITEEELRPVLASPLTMIISLGELKDGVAHPRLAGSFARVLGRYVREERLLTLMDALRKMTLLPAQRLETRAPAMKNKGRIRVGADADITIFDPETVLDRATYADPLRSSAGIHYVLVNGVPVVSHGKLIDGRAPGRPIRAPVQ